MTILDPKCSVFHLRRGKLLIHYRESAAATRRERQPRTA